MSSLDRFMSALTANGWQNIAIEVVELPLRLTKHEYTKLTSSTTPPVFNEADITFPRHGGKYLRVDCYEVSATTPHYMLHRHCSLQNKGPALLKAYFIYGPNSFAQTSKHSFRNVATNSLEQHIKGFNDALSIVETYGPIPSLAALKQDAQQSHAISLQESATAAARLEEYTTEFNALLSEHASILGTTPELLRQSLPSLADLIKIMDKEPRLTMEAESSQRYFDATAEALTLLSSVAHLDELDLPSP